MIQTSRIRFFLIAGILIVTLCATGTYAAEEGTDRYRGSFLVEHYSGTDYLWYVHPTTGERYAVNSSNEFSRLLTNLGVGVTAKTMAQLPGVGVTTKKVSSELLMKHRGSILIQVDADGKAYYLNPLDLKMYYLHNGKDGLTTAQSLAIDISQERLEQIPVTEALGFNQVTKGLVTSADETIDTSIYGDIFQILESQHLRKDTFTGTDLFYGSLKGMAQATGDIHTEFYTPEKNQKQHEYFAGNASIEGIGAAIDARNSSIYISWVVKGAPADRAGLKSKDQILKVDGASTDGMSVDAAVSRIKGPAGTQVVLTVFRSSTGMTQEYRITRERVEIPDVEGELIGDVAYFKFSLFTGTVVDQFQKLLDALVTPSVKGIVVDMRDNIGGITQSAGMLADYWLTQGQTVYYERRNGQDTNYIATDGKAVPEVTTVILTNDGTASASEIFTSSLRYHKQATVIGSTTFGKGTGQNLYDFADGSGLKITTFEWLTPDGTSIDQKGITPDIIVGTSDYGDPQLDRALQFIRVGY